MEATRTAEVRWFHRGEIPDAVADWFAALGESVVPEQRTDRYLAPTDDALGVKLRGGAVEAKRRDAVGDALVVGDARAAVETWVKWSFPLAATDVDPQRGWVAVHKTRWQRHSEPAGEAGGCALELSRLTVGDGVWWSVCLEAADDGVADARTMLEGAARRWLGVADAPALAAKDASGYPAWLRACE